MELDLQNPLTMNNGHHYDIVSHLFANESDHMPCLLTSNDSDLRFSIRRTAFSLISQLNLDPFTAYLAVNYVDRFLSKQQILDNKPWIPHILVAASLSLAAKMTNSDLSIIIADLQRGEGFEFDALSIHRMETIVLAALQWRMRSITPFSFLSYFVSVLKIKDSVSAQAIVQRASDIILDAQHVVKVLEYKPSTIAASALLCAVQELIPFAFSSHKAAISKSEYINEGTLLECLCVMQETVKDAMASGTMGDQQRTSLRSVGNIKRRRLNGFFAETTFQISQTQQC